VAQGFSPAIAIAALKGCATSYKEGSLMKRFVSAFVPVASLIAVVVVRGASAPACDADNGGITLPQGFCAAVVATDVGRARHLVVAPNGDVFASTETGRGGAGGGIVALRDTDNDGKLDTRETFGEGSTTGVALRNGYIYYATTNSIVRYTLAAGALKPTGSPEVIAEGLTDRRQHAAKGIAFDGKGGVYVNIGAPSNACQQPDRQPNVAGQDPCPLLEIAGGIWRFDENKLGQKQSDGKRYATGMRQMVGLTWHDNSLWVVMHNRDSLNTLWPEKFTAEQNGEWPAETLLKVSDGSNFGWPYCFYNNAEGKLVTNPEYGGDGKTTERCGSFTPPTVAFPGHWAPNDVLFYDGTQFPSQYRGGAFVAFHGSWNRAPLPQAGYNVTFVPFAGGKPSGKYEVFANGFAGQSPLMNPGQEAARPGGLAVGPDGSLYITEDAKGKIWRVMYRK
jgi:glucose/arabinose dehydrogenase